MKPLPPSQVIAEWVSANVKFYGSEPHPLSYEGGWFVLRVDNRIVGRYRAAQIIHMTAQLNERAKAKG